MGQLGNGFTKTLKGCRVELEQIRGFLSAKWLLAGTERSTGADVRPCRLLDVVAVTHRWLHASDCDDRPVDLAAALPIRIAPRRSRHLTALGVCGPHRTSPAPTPAVRPVARRARCPHSRRSIHAADRRPTFTASMAASASSASKRPERGRLSSVKEHERTILFVRHRPRFVRRMIAAEVHQTQRMVGVLESPFRTLAVPANKCGGDRTARTRDRLRHTVLPSSPCRHAARRFVLQELIVSFVTTGTVTVGSSLDFQLQ